jgi:hypothetical protein
MHIYRSILSLALLTLTACGGDSAAPKTENANENILVTPQVDLTGKTGAVLPIAKKVQGITTIARATVDSSFSNAIGSLRHASSNNTVQGSLTIGVTASDNDLMQKVSLYLPEVSRSFLLCSDDCTPEFQTTITGLNPQLAGAVSGPLRIELIVEDSAGNSAVVDALNLNWQPIQISSLNATRENGVVSVSWSGNSSLQRYNLYAATESGLTSTNALNLENGLQQLAINGTFAEFPDTELAKDVHLLVTGIDNGGESGTSVQYSIPRLEGDTNQSPVANNDTYTLNEDDTLNVNVLANDQDPEGQLLSIDSIILQSVNGTIENDEFGNITYTPNINFYGSDSISYRIVDTEGAIDDAIVSIEVLPINDNPVAINDTYSVDINGNIDSQNISLLINDTDIDGDVLSIMPVPIQPPTFGTVSINTDGSFSYQANNELL